MSQYSIQQSLGNASGVAVSPINADATLSTGVALNSSLWAGIGVFARGKPFTVLAVTESNYEDVLGEPLKPSSGSQFIDRNLNPKKIKKTPKNGCLFDTACVP